MNYKTFRSNQGFTFIELIVVVAVIGLLASAAISNITTSREVARDAVRLQDMKALEQAFYAFYLDNQRFPTDADDGVSTSGQIIGVGNEIDIALAPYLPDIPIDPRHDAGTGEAPTAGALYYYSYDPTHYISSDCTVSITPAIPSGPVFAFNSFESDRDRVIDTCIGADMNIDEADFNKAL